MVETTRLKNGVTVVMERMDSVRSVAFGIWVDNGSKHETREINGISHFIEHMLFKGTEKRTAKDIADEMDYVGGQINAYTSKEYTCYHTRTLDTHFGKALDVMADMFLNSVFDDSEIEKEGGVILEEISMYEDSPEDLAHELVSLGVFKGNPLCYPILGTHKTVSSFNSAKMKEYYKKRYTPENTVISIAGSFERDRALDAIEHYFGGFTGGGEKRTEKTPAYTPVRVKKIKDIEQAHVVMTFPGIKLGTDETYALSIFDTIFGGGMSSRLFQKIREEMGLVYSIYSSPAMYKQTGLYSIYAGMGVSRAESVINLIMREINGLKTDRITEEQLQKTKEQIKSGFIISLESTSNRMLSIGRSRLLLGKVQTADEIIAKIDAVTLESVYALLENIFDFDKVCVSAVGKVDGLDIDGALGADA